MSPTTTEGRPPGTPVGSGRPRGAGRPGAQAIDPRIRQRRAEVARHQRRRRRWLLVAVAVLGVLVAAGWVALHSRLLSARVVTVVGSPSTPAAAVVAASGLGRHPPLVDVNPGRAATGVERLPWVRTATVARQWPDGVRITVAQRTPVAAVARWGAPGPVAWAEVDVTGRVLALGPERPAGLVDLAAPGLPGAPGSSVTGTTPPGSLVAGSALPAAALPGLTVAAGLPRAFAGQVAAVQVDQGGQVTLSLVSPVTVELGTTTELHAKYEDVASILAGAVLHAGDVVDVSVPASPTVTSG